MTGSTGSTQGEMAVITPAAKPIASRTNISSPGYGPNSFARINFRPSAGLSH
jgi:hypothetical protein